MWQRQGALLIWVEEARLLQLPQILSPSLITAALLQVEEDCCPSPGSGRSMVLNPQTTANEPWILSHCLWIPPSVWRQNSHFVTWQIISLSYKAISCAVLYKVWRFVPNANSHLPAPLLSLALELRKGKPRPQRHTLQHFYSTFHVAAAFSALWKWISLLFLVILF